MTEQECLLAVPEERFTLLSNVNQSININVFLYFRVIKKLTHEALRTSTAAQSTTVENTGLQTI